MIMEEMKIEFKQMSEEDLSSIINVAQNILKNRREAEQKQLWENFRNAYYAYTKKYGGITIVLDESEERLSSGAFLTEVGVINEETNW